MAQPGAAVAYRMIVHGHDGQAACRGRFFGTLRAAHSAAAALLRADAGHAIAALELQRGVRVDFACPDPYATSVGAASHYAWDTIEMLGGELLADLRRAGRAREAAALARPTVRRTSLLAGAVAMLLLALTALGMSAPGLLGLATDAVRAGDAIARLPVTCAPTRPPAERQFGPSGFPLESTRPRGCPTP